MEIELKRSSIPSLEMIGKCSNTCIISTDSVVPDNSEDILRILSTDYSCKIRSKDINNDKVIISGEVDSVAVYVPESGEGICTLNMKSEFETTFDVPGADSSCSSFAELKVISFELKIVNPRKIHVQGEIAVEQECYKMSDLSVLAECDVLPDCIYTKKQSAKVLRIAYVTEKTISIEEDIPIGENSGQELIYASSRFISDTQELIGSKLIAKGRCLTTALFYDGITIEQKEFSSDFSQLFNLNESTDNACFRLNIIPTGEYYDIQDNYFVMDIRAVIEVICYEESEVNYFADAYSTNADLTADYSTFDSTSAIYTKIGKIADTANYDTSEIVAKVISSKVVNSDLRFSEDKITLPYSVDVVYMTEDGTLKSCRLRKNAETDLHLAEGESISWSNVKQLDCSIRSNSKSIDCSINAELAIEITRNVSIKQISKITLEEIEETSKKPSLYLRKVHNNNLWDLAKQYSSSEADIMKANGLEAGESIEGKILIIPVKQ